MSDMARYIDADKLLEEVKRSGHALSEWSTLGVCAVIERQPTADVVPKSDVEKLREINSLLTEAGQEWQKRYNNAKAEVEALEKEVERLKHILDSYALQYGTVKDQKKVIDKVKAEVAWAIFDNVDEIAYRYLNDADYSAGDMIYDLNELKKKYTEREE